MFGHGPGISAVVEPKAEEVRVIASLVSALCPRYVIETGTYEGRTARAIGECLEIGHLDTMDTDQESVRLSRKEVEGLPVTVHHCSSLDFIPDRPIDLAFLDSDIWDIRFKELGHFRPFLAPLGIVAIHDTRSLIDRPSGWQRIDLLTANGLSLFQPDA
jgi:predicted O-methyltransferase YrrM